MNYARPQQYRRLSRAGRSALVGLIVAVLGMLLLSIGFALPGGLLLALAVTIGFRAVTGCPSLGTAESALARGTRFGARWPHSSNMAGGFATRCARRAVGRSTRWRSRRTGSDSPSRPRPGCTTSASSVGCSTRQAGLVGAGGDGVGVRRFLSCAWFPRLAWSATSVVCWWSRSTDWLRSRPRTRRICDRQGSPRPTRTPFPPADQTRGPHLHSPPPRRAPLDHDPARNHDRLTTHHPSGRPAERIGRPVERDRPSVKQQLRVSRKRAEDRSRVSASDRRAHSDCRSFMSAGR